MTNSQQEGRVNTLRKYRTWVSLVAAYHFMLLVVVVVVVVTVVVAVAAVVVVVCWCTVYLGAPNAMIGSRMLFKLPGAGELITH